MILEAGTYLQADLTVCLDPKASQDMKASTKAARWGGVGDCLITEHTVKDKCEHRRIKHTVCRHCSLLINWQQQKL